MATTICPRCAGHLTPFVGVVEVPHTVADLIRTSVTVTTRATSLKIAGVRACDRCCYVEELSVLRRAS